MIDLILLLMLVCSVWVGWKRGALKDGRYVLGILLSLLCVPVVSPIIENLLIKYVIWQIIPGLNSAAVNFITYAMRFSIFSVSVYIVKKIFYSFTDFSIPYPVAYVDKMAGAVLGFFKVSIFIWIISYLLNKTTVVGMDEVAKILSSSSLYTCIANHNLLQNLFAKYA